MGSWQSFTKRDRAFQRQQWKQWASLLTKFLFLNAVLVFSARLSPLLCVFPLSSSRVVVGIIKLFFHQRRGNLISLPFPPPFLCWRLLCKGCTVAAALTTTTQRILLFFGKSKVSFFPLQRSPWEWRSWSRDQGRNSSSTRYTSSSSSLFPYLKWRRVVQC